MFWKEKDRGEVDMSWLRTCTDVRRLQREKWKLGRDRKEA